MAGKGVGSVVKAVAEYQYPWRERLLGAGGMEATEYH